MTIRYTVILQPMATRMPPPQTVNLQRRNCIAADAPRIGRKRVPRSADPPHATKEGKENTRKRTRGRRRRKSVHIAKCSNAKHPISRYHIQSATGTRSRKDGGRIMSVSRWRWPTNHAIYSRLIWVVFLTTAILTAIDGVGA